MKNREEEFYEVYEDVIELYVNEEFTEEETVNSIYDSEDNYNNCDTKNQVIYSEEEISNLLESTVDWLAQQDDRCSDCARLLDDEDYLVDSEPRPYGDSVVYENVTIGYRCRCGNKEEF